MFTNGIARTLACLFVAAPLLAACSAAPEDGSTTASSSEAVTSEASGARSCSSRQACAAGDYCAPSSTTSTCGRGTCVASPQDCPMIQAPVCGCDGNVYLNSCFAEMGNPGEPGTTSTGNMYVAPTTSSLTGTWSRASGSGSTATSETLVLGSDGSYTLTESVGCGRHSSTCTQAQSAGTFAMSTVGIVFSTTSATNADNLATEFYLENTCPITGALQLVGFEPPGSDTSVSLSLN